MVFGVFSKMIHNLPDQAVLRTLDLECGMLEEDLEHQRLTSDGDALSILSFGQFVQMARNGVAIPGAKSLPFDHLEFYRETVTRLVRARELPPSAMELFEDAFPLNL